MINQDNSQKHEFDLEKRTLLFSKNILGLVRSLPASTINSP